MSKAERIKKEHIKKVNELLDKGHAKDEINEEVIDFRSSDNVTKSSKDFISKMNRLDAANKVV
tara:strand:- start:164 stop:352 length:189 start_codon:yes stop_codon:yes gene_type:complete